MVCVNIMTILMTESPIIEQWTMKTVNDRLLLYCGLILLLLRNIETIINESNEKYY